MALIPGTRLGPYEIVAALGAGGMGQVYRAHDTKLNRDVALKILPDAFASDSDRLARFTREAQTLASLNHPNIAHILGLEESGGVRALVMELVEGDDLSQRIARGAIPVDEALPIAKQIAEALEAAHEQGIIHRDLKPANIKVRPDGTVKVLDFGLAKAMEPVWSAPNVSQSPTITTPAMTQAGVILGTAAYMSPEQAKGKAVDRRADIWAFGCVLFEMLSGRAPFTGETVSETLADVMKSEPPWQALPSSVPANLQWLIRHCLVKEPRQRIRDVGDVRLALEGAFEVAGAQTAATAPGGPMLYAVPRPVWKRAIPAVVAAVTAAALSGSAVWTFRPAARLPIVRFRTQLPDGVAIPAAPSRQQIAISADGSAIALAGGSELFLHTLANNQARQLANVGIGAAVDPVFSPDGRWLAFFTTDPGNRALKKVAVTGGAPVTLCPAGLPYGVTWSDGQIVFSTAEKGITRVSENGGAVETLVAPTPGQLMQSPQLLRGGDALLFAVAPTSGATWDSAKIVVQPLKGGQRKTLIDGTDPRYAPTGHLVYTLGGVLFAAPFDVRRLELTGGPVPMVEGVLRTSLTGAAFVAFSNSGTLAYVPGPSTGGSTHLDLAWTGTDGGSTPLKMTPSRYETPRISPDGRRAALGNVDNSGPNIWVIDLSGASSPRRLTFGGKNTHPEWSPDGDHIAFQSDRDDEPGIYWQRTDGTGTAERLTKAGSGVVHTPESWAPGGKRLLFSATKGNDVTLQVLSLEDRKTEPFGGVHSTMLTNASFSPDGHWVVYDSDETGTSTVYVQPFPATGARSQISRDGEVGHHPLWSRDGKRLLYIPSTGRFVGINVTMQPGFTFSTPVPAPREFTIGNAPWDPRNHDIAPDGRILGLVIAGEGANGLMAEPQRIEFVLNWFEELKQRAPTK